MFPGTQLPKLDPTPSGITIFSREARPLFERARRRGDLRHLTASLFHRCSHLPRLEDYVSHGMIAASQLTQIQSVELDQIRGSVNGSDDFDCNFYPLNDHLENRWIRIASMMLQGSVLPPVVLIRVGQMYFVVDGHHRVSVARMLKMAMIDALITAGYD